ncbi:MAG: hypothetical protein GKR89_33460 [Candidatus Latescibacteria bacterium]|nr:hypothetical protein [Candidatus Latescibacterota bacterium]
MNSIDALLDGPLVETIGWALVHFVWQGALVALATALGLGLIREEAPRMRYALMSLGMGVMGLLPVATALTLYPWQGDIPAAGSQPIPASLDSPLAIAAGAGWLAVSQSLPGVMGVVLLVWGGGVLLFSARLLGGWVLLRRARMAVHPIEARWQIRLQELCAEMGVRRRVCALAGTHVSVPMVTGLLRPVILMPLAVLSSLPPDQVEAVLRHELAHLRRWDNLVNGLQVLVETLLFYHPAVWWLSGRMRTEREYCCDDHVVRSSGDPTGYARTLVRLEELRAPRSALAVAATGGHLLTRVRRLLIQPGRGTSKGRLESAGAALGAMILWFVVAACYSTVDRTNGQASAEAGGIPLAEESPPSSERQARPYITLRVGAGDTLQLTDSLVSVPASSIRQTDSTSAVAFSRRPRQPGEEPTEWTAVGLSELGARLEQLRGRIGDAMIIIEGDSRVQHERIRRIMDIARKAGYVDQVIATAPRGAAERIDTPAEGTDAGSMQQLEPMPGLEQSRAFGLRLEADGSWSLGGRVSVGADTVWHASGRSLDGLAVQLEHARLVAGEVSLIFARVQEGVLHHDVARVMEWAAKAGFTDQVVSEEGGPQ